MDDAALSRRDFLERTAYAAGLAGMASLPPSALLAEAADAAARRNPLPSPRNIEIDHFVILMMENRSFDHYFGWLSGEADGIQKQTFLNPEGQPVETRHFKYLGNTGVEYKGCGHPDPGHGWNSGRVQLNQGFMAKGSGNDEFALTYFNEGELPYIHPAAKAYTLYDRWFCSLLASTYPNRYYKWSAQSGGVNDNRLPTETYGWEWETIFDRAINRGLTARYYQSDLPASALFGRRAIPWTNNISRYYADCAAGLLPNITIVDPAFLYTEEGTSTDEHPYGDVRMGQAFMADVVNAFINSPNYRRGAMFIIYDEWGGFFDHVRPPRVVDDLGNRDLFKDFGQMGFRVPAVTISPWTRRRSGGLRVDHGIYGHESILKLISYRFGIGYLNKRHRYTRNVGRSFDWVSKPDFEPVALPDPPQVATSPCSQGGGDIVMQSAESSHEADVEGLANLAETLGFRIYDAKPELVFSQPDAMMKAIRSERAKRAARERAERRRRRQAVRR